MTTIDQFMKSKHQECDEFFALAESAVAKNDWPIAEQNWQAFSIELEQHLDCEENTLFPAFEQATGMTQGPTQVMRYEHEQMRALQTDLSKALAQQNKDQFLGLAETLMVMMQQHNMKEEMMLYPMAQQHVGSPELVEQLKSDHSQCSETTD